MNLSCILKKLFENNEEENKNKLKTSFVNWRKTANELGAKENATIIQRFLKERINNPNDKRKQFDRFGDLLTKYLGRIILYKLYHLYLNSSLVFFLLFEHE